MESDDRWVREGEGSMWLLRSPRLANSTAEERREIAAEAFAQHNWLTFIRCHNRSHRAHALLHARQAGLSGPNYWSLVSIFWRDCDRPAINWQVWQTLWAAPDAGRAEHVMSPAQRASLAALPPVIQIFRGCRFIDDGPLAWTLDQKLSHYYAHRFDGGEPRVLTGLVRRDDVLLFIADSDVEHAEIIAFAHSVEIVRVDPADHEIATLAYWRWFHPLAPPPLAACHCWAASAPWREP
jgi:hypothetical protein